MYNKKLKSIAFSMALAAGMLLPASASAQPASERPGGLFSGFGWFKSEFEESGMLRQGEPDEGGYALFNQQFGTGENDKYQLSNQQFGSQDPDAPLGSGLFILAAAGAGYALKKRKNNKNH